MTWQSSPGRSVTFRYWRNPCPPAGRGRVVVVAPFTGSTRHRRCPCRCERRRPRGLLHDQASRFLIKTPAARSVAAGQATTTARESGRREQPRAGVLRHELVCGHEQRELADAVVAGGALRSTRRGLRAADRRRRWRSTQPAMAAAMVSGFDRQGYVGTPGYRRSGPILSSSHRTSTPHFFGCLLLSVPRVGVRGIVAPPVDS